MGVPVAINSDAHSTRELDYAQTHLRILSGLYGLLRPLDNIQPYRLEMGTRLKNPRGGNLYAYWADTPARALAEQARQLRTKLLVNLYKTRDNLGYYLPYWRELNDSHCVSIASYLKTDIEEQGINLGDYIDELFNDDVPVGRYRESVQPDEDN